MSKELSKCNILDLIDEIYIYENKEAIIELKKRIREDSIETKNISYYMLISQIYFVLATSYDGENGYDNLDIALTYNKSDYGRIMGQLPIDHPARLYFEAIDNLIESEDKYAEYIFEIETKLKLYKMQNYVIDLLEIQSEAEVYDLAGNIICIKVENEVELNDRFNINNNQKSEEK